MEIGNQHRAIAVKGSGHKVRGDAMLWLGHSSTYMEPPKPVFLHQSDTVHGIPHWLSLVEIQGQPQRRIKGQGLAWLTRSPAYECPG